MNTSLSEQPGLLHQAADRIYTFAEQFDAKEFAQQHDVKVATAALATLVAYAIVPPWVSGTISFITAIIISGQDESTGWNVAKIAERLRIDLTADERSIGLVQSSVIKAFLVGSAVFMAHLWIPTTGALILATAGYVIAKGSTVPSLEDDFLGEE